jgi:hypothetical protein
LILYICKSSNTKKMILIKRQIYYKSLLLVWVLVKQKNTPRSKSRLKETDWDNTHKQGPKLTPAYIESKGSIIIIKPGLVESANGVFLWQTADYLRKIWRTNYKEKSNDQHNSTHIASVSKVICHCIEISKCKYI